MRINLITSLTGFPNGTANAKRINLLGKSILESGHEFCVYTNGIQFNRFNTEFEGTFQGINFEYLHRKSINQRLTKSNKILYFIIGCINLFRRIIKFDKNNDIVYSYNHGNLFNVYIIILCKLFNIKIVQEINEWYHNDLGRKIEKFVIENPLIKKSAGAIVISSEIQKKVSFINPNIKLLKVPVLEDFSNSFDENNTTETSDKYCFWMGDVDGYINDVLFIIEACAKLLASEFTLQCFISGPCSEETFNRIKEFAEKKGYPFGNIRLLGFVSDEELIEYQNNAFLFIVPLWNNERSKSRFPTKIASFIKAEKPIISCKIGELGEMFTDSENILFYEEGNSDDLVDKITILLTDNDKYLELVKNSYALAFNKFNYLTYAKDFNLFFTNL